MYLQFHIKPSIFLYDQNNQEKYIHYEVMLRDDYIKLQMFLVKFFFAELTAVIPLANRV